jgi:hypothetical protein
MFLIGDCREVVYEDFWECRAGSQGTVQPQAKKDYVVCVSVTQWFSGSQVIAGYLSNHLTFFCVLCLTTCVIHNHARCVIPSMCTFSFLSVISTYICRKLSRSLARTAKMHALWVTPFCYYHSWRRVCETSGESTSLSLPQSNYFFMLLDLGLSCIHPTSITIIFLSPFYWLILLWRYLALNPCICTFLFVSSLIKVPSLESLHIHPFLVSFLLKTPCLKSLHICT